MKIIIREFDPKGHGPQVLSTILLTYKASIVPKIGEWISIDSLKRTVEVVQVEHRPEAADIVITVEAAR